MSKKLLVVNRGQWMEVQFDQQITIGRDIFNSLCLQDGEVSRSHAIIFEQNDEMIVKDLKSRNGIFVRGEKVTESALSNGDELIIGGTVIIFNPEDSLDIQLSLSKRGKYLIERNVKEKAEKPEVPSSDSNIFQRAELDKSLDRLFTGDPDASTFLALPQALAMLQTATEINRRDNQKERYQVAVTRALDILGGSRCVVMEVNEDKEHLKMRAICSTDGRHEIHIAQQILKIVVGRERGVYCPAVTRDERFRKLIESGHNVYSFATAPIGHNHLHGFIYIESDDLTTSYDFASLRRLHFIALLLGNVPMGSTNNKPAEAIQRIELGN